LRIALDATYSIGAKLSGVGVYSRKILEGMPVAHSEARYLFCYRPHRFLKSFQEKLPSGAARALLLGSPLALPCDLFHGLNQRIDAKPARRRVSTFHDLFVLTAEYSTPDFRRRFAEQARSAAERSDLVIAVSEFTAGQVHHLLGVERSRIRVVHHGVDPVLYPPPLSQREPMILFTGALQTRKNIVRLLDAFEQGTEGWRLVLAGGWGYGREAIEERIARSPRRDSIDLCGYVSDAQLRGLYARASIFAFPSLDEGFGMPVLDAMSWGVPVLTSNRSSLPEIAGEAALLVDPFDTGAIADGLRKLTERESLREELALLGMKQAERFPWEAAIEKTWNLYQELRV
jgi:glycosyltransferase involved in cell wall biosynthesis